LHKEDDGYFHLKLTQKAEDGTGNGKRQKKERRHTKKHSEKGCLTRVFCEDWRPGILPCSKRKYYGNF